MLKSELLPGDILHAHNKQVNSTISCLDLEHDPERRSLVMLSLDRDQPPWTSGYDEGDVLHDTRVLTITVYRDGKVIGESP